MQSHFYTAKLVFKPYVYLLYLSGIAQYKKVVVVGQVGFVYTHNIEFAGTSVFAIYKVCQYTIANPQLQARCDVLRYDDLCRYSCVG